MMLCQTSEKRATKIILRQNLSAFTDCGQKFRYVKHSPFACFGRHVCPALTRQENKSLITGHRIGRAIGGGGSNFISVVHCVKTTREGPIHLEHFGLEL